MISGQIIKNVLKEKGIKQKWLADKLKIATSSLSEILKRDLKVAELGKICEILNLDTCQVIDKCKKEGPAIPPRTTEPSKVEI